MRSERPGFIQFVKRMNVLLTRCQRGLIIVSSEAFLGPEGKGSGTLLGKLVEHWQSQYSLTWINWRSVANASVDLPGVTLNKGRPIGNPETQNKSSSTRDLRMRKVAIAQEQKESQKSTTSSQKPLNRTKLIKAPKAKSQKTAKSNGS